VSRQERSASFGTATTALPGRFKTLCRWSVSAIIGMVYTDLLAY